MGVECGGNKCGVKEFREISWRVCVPKKVLLTELTANSLMVREGTKNSLRK